LSSLHVMFEVQQCCWRL